MVSILLADDSVLIRRIMVSALEAQGWQVKAACDGRQALQYAQQATFDLVVTDWYMPNMNGDELVEALRNMPAYESTPILVLTSETQDRLKDQARHVGANGWLTKPFDPDRLVSLVTVLIDEALPS